MTYDDLDRPPLDPVALRHALVGPGTWWREVYVSTSTESTNTDLAELARADAPEGTLVTTDHQSAGRGRLNRGWQSPPGASIAVSFLVRPDPVPATRWPWLPLLTGLAVVEAVRQTAEVDADLKWPNDVLVGDRKLAGILLERVETPTGPAAVVGVGLNVSLRNEDLPVSQATSLLLLGASTIDRSVLIRSYARTFEALYRAWAAAEGDPSVGVQASYVRRCVTVGRAVRVSMPDGSAIEGDAHAVDGAGRLVVDADDGRHSLSAGDITHVRPAT